MHGFEQHIMHGLPQARSYCPLPTVQVASVDLQSILFSAPLESRPCRFVSLDTGKPFTCTLSGSAKRQFLTVVMKQYISLASHQVIVISPCLSLISATFMVDCEDRVQIADCVLAALSRRPRPSRKPTPLCQRILVCRVPLRYNNSGQHVQPRRCFDYVSVVI